MPNKCSAPNCNSNYYPQSSYIPVFKLPNEPPELRQKWIYALHREDITSLKHIFVCLKHFREEDVEQTYKLQNGDGSITEIPRGQPKLRKGAIPCFLPDCPSYYSAPSSWDHRFSFESKQEDQFTMALQLSRESRMAEDSKYHIKTLEELVEKLPLQTLPSNWLYWLSADSEVHFVTLSKSHQDISVQSSLTINSTLDLKAFRKEENITLSLTQINDIRQIEVLLAEIGNTSTLPSPSDSIQQHIDNARFQISKAISKLEVSISASLDSQDSIDNSSRLARLQFITCQLENSIVSKTRRRYNIITQVLALKSHLISPSCYNYLQSLDCLALPHYHTLEKLYSSFGLDSEYITYLNQATVNFSPQEKNVIVQMDEIHVTSDVSYKGGEIIGSCLNPDDPIKTVFAIMVSSLHKKWSTVVRLVPLSTTSAKDIHPIIVQVIDDIEQCGLLVQALCTDNYPLNVNVFKLFSSDQKTLQPLVSHPTSEKRPLILTFDFVHILKTIRNNWLNLKNENQVFIYPSFEDFYPTYTKFPLTIQKASFNDIRLIYKLEQNNIAKMAPRLTTKACWPSKLERQNVKLALRVFHESTSAALQISNESRPDQFKCQTSDFIDIVVKMWKIFNINRPNKDVRFKDEYSKQLVLNDPRFDLCHQIVNWLDVWRSLPGKEGKLSPQTFTSFKHTCLALPILVNHLTSQCGFAYVLTYFLQTDPLEHHFGLYRMMSGSNYHVSYSQILETERRLKISSILKLFSQQSSFKESNLHNFIKSFSSIELDHDNNQVDLEPFLSKLQDLSNIVLDKQTIQSLAFIAGYCVHQYLKRSQNCRSCRDFLTVDKELLFDPEETTIYKLIDIMDRGSLKWPSDTAFNSIVLVWRIIMTLKQCVDVWSLFVSFKPRKTLIEISIRILENDSSEYWRNRCLICNTEGWDIARKLLLVASNCLISNMVKNYNSFVASRGEDSRKLKKLKIK